MTKSFHDGYQAAMADCTAAYMRGGADALITWVQENNLSLRNPDSRTPADVRNLYTLPDAPLDTGMLP